MYKNLFEKCIGLPINSILENENPQKIINNLRNAIYSISKYYTKLNPNDFNKNTIIEGDVFVGNNVNIQSNVHIKGPVILCDNVMVGTGSMLRDNVYIGENSIIGYSNEVSNSIILNETLISHFGAISWSIIGSNVNLGSHVATMSNLLVNEDETLEKKKIKFSGFEKYEPSSHKLGSLIGDNCKLASYVGLSPGTVLEKNSYIYPGIVLPWGKYPKDSIVYEQGYKNKILIKEKGI
ncbi:bacterial transferase hexapeptide family protein [[Clostridium] bifermentans ATCC 19299]|uniref:DapH/DapD/GlmU-related protein n=1 Tax=Paraclostridium bifermentans TaxID=1490 RepID=UPI00038DB2FE|nr:DapH/DapD/GlmU-related protein [Paraclostridium bifermentans]EQK41154.1 bacterial transferase hexapeptide family protein [[Clostridium] bifermentans ATCC 19299] [Paraclostridium bifermentans ATCC 19299]